MIHNTPHPQAGHTVTLNDGRTLLIEDWWDRVSGTSWQDSRTPVAFHYALRAGTDGLPLDNDVLYGKDTHELGHLVHATEIAQTNEGS